MLFKLPTYLILVIAGFLNCALPAEAKSLNPQFVALLNAAAAVRYFKVAFPGKLFIANGKPVQGWVYYEGAIQADTFWVRNCTNSPHDSGQILPGWIIGMSGSEYWTYRDDAVAISPKSSSALSPLQIRAQNVLFFVRKALGIGAAINPGSFHLDSDNSFTAELGDEKIRGHFDVGENGYPTQCEYSDAGGSTVLLNAKAVVIYTYSNHSAFPVGFIAKIFKGPLEIEETEYRILACDFGTNSLPAGGYTVDYMTNFGAVNLRVRDLVGTTVFKDGAVYLRTSDGKMKLQNSVWPTTQRETPVRRMVVIAVMCALAVLPLWFLVRSRWVMNRKH